MKQTPYTECHDVNLFEFMDEMFAGMLGLELEEYILKAEKTTDARLEIILINLWKAYDKVDTVRFEKAKRIFNSI